MLMYHKKKKSLNEIYTRELVIKVLKDLAKEFYPVYSHVAAEISRMVTSFQQQGIPMGPEIREEINLIIFEKSPWFTQEVEKIEEKVFTKNGITAKSFRRCVENIYQSDPIVQNLRKEIETSMEKSLHGQKPLLPTGPINEKFTAEAVLNIIKQSAKGFIQKIIETCLRIKENGGSISINNPDLLDTLNNSNTETLSLELINKLGVSNEIDHPQKLYHHALNTYQTSNADFKEKVGKVEVANRSI